MPLVCSTANCTRPAVRRRPDSPEAWVCSWHPDREPPPLRGDSYVVPEPEKKARPLPTAPAPALMPAAPVTVTEAPAPAITAAAPVKPPAPDVTLPRDVELLLDTAAAHPDPTLHRLGEHARAYLDALVRRLGLLTQQEQERREAQVLREAEQTAALAAVEQAHQALAAAETALAAVGINPRTKGPRSKQARPPVTCESCGITVIGNQGLGLHRKAKHPTTIKAGAA